MKKTTSLLCLLLITAISAHAGDTPPTASKETKALSFPFSYTGEGLGNFSGGYKQGAVYDGLLSIGLQGDLDKLAGWKGGTFLISGIYPHGPSITDKYVHDFNGVSNIDTYDSIRLYEVWLQQELADGKISLRLGQILADAEFFISDSAALFMNSAFGAIPLISQNFNEPVFPAAAPGIRLRWTPTDALSAQLGVFDGNVGDIAVDNRHGVHWNLTGVLAITEIAYKWNTEKKSTGLPGVSKLGVFFHTPQINDDIPGAAGNSDTGAYIIVDQQLWRKPGTDNQGLNGFMRIGCAPEDRNIVPFYFDTGFNLKGPLPGRDKDIAGIAFSYTKLSGNLSNDDGQPLGSHHEATLEATYKIALKDWLTVQPDFQYIFNPGACNNAVNAIVAGIRFNLTF